MAFANAGHVGFKTVEEIIAWQLAREFKQEVLELLQASPAAMRRYKYRDQLLDAMDGTDANISEGFHRRSLRQFVVFLSYARASHAEAETRLKAGVAAGYFTQQRAARALHLAKRCCMAILRLIQSLERQIAAEKR